MIHVLLLDNHDSFTYNLVEIIRETEGCACTVVAHDNIAAVEIAQFEKIIFSPGPGLPHEFPAMHEVLQRLGGTSSILGVCLGMQAIAEFFGGSLYNLAVPHHGQRREINVLEPMDLIYQSLPRRLNVGLYHSWAVRAGVPDELEVTAVTNEGLIMSLRHRALDIRGVQFHPESYMTEHGPTLLRNWLHA